MAAVKKLKTNVKEKFSEIRKALEFREKLLYRQIDVIEQSKLSLSTSGSSDEIYFIPEKENDLLNCIRTFGKFNLDNLNFTNDLYTNEDYISPVDDHETMHKCLNNRNFLLKDNDNSDDYNKDDNHNINEECKEIVVNFSNNKKLIKDNVDNINESIIHITLNEAKKLIEKTKLNLNMNNTETNMFVENEMMKTKEETDALVENEFISQSSQTDLKNKKFFINRPSNITINNCNGVINLKNISNLTISCVTQDSFNIPTENSNNRSNDSSSLLTTTKNSSTNESRQTNKSEPDKGQHSSLSSSYSVDSNNTSVSGIQSEDVNTTKDSENNSVNCEFYNRLLTEIKRSLKESQKAPVEYIPLGHKEFKAAFGKNNDQVNKINTKKDEENKISSSLNEEIPTSQSSLQTSTNNTMITTNDSYNRKLLLRNFENLKVVLENNENDIVSIEQWLSEIICETEPEP